MKRCPLLPPALVLAAVALFTGVAAASPEAPAGAAPEAPELVAPSAALDCPASEPAAGQPPEPIWLGDGSCEPMPPLCEATGKQVEYCDCIAAGGQSGFCRCRWCLGESIEMCKVHKPIP